MSTAMNRIRSIAVAVAVATAALTGLAVSPQAAGSVAAESADVVGQGEEGPVVSSGGATIQRNAQGISVKLTMPTPEPGSYRYPPGNAFQPEGAQPGHPEAFSLWVFVFNYPDLCSRPCDSNDLGDTPARGGAFNAAGHVVGGDTLQLSGRVSTNSDPFEGSAMLVPETAEVHLAVAPHGELQPEVLPDQIKKPIGSPPFWWLAVFGGHA